MAESMLSKINASGLFEEAKLVIPVPNMALNHLYIIQEIKVVNTRFGRSILLDTSEGKIWVPKRMSVHMTDGWIKIYVSNTLAIVNRGAYKKQSGNAPNVAKLEIVAVEENN